MPFRKKKSGKLLTYFNIASSTSRNEKENKKAKRKHNFSGNVYVLCNICLSGGTSASTLLLNKIVFFSFQSTKPTLLGAVAL